MEAAKERRAAKQRGEASGFAGTKREHNGRRFGIRSASQHSRSRNGHTQQGNGLPERVNRAQVCPFVVVQSMDKAGSNRPVRASMREDAAAGMSDGIFPLIAVVLFTPAEQHATGVFPDIVLALSNKVLWFLIAKILPKDAADGNGPSVAQFICEGQ